MNNVFADGLNVLVPFVQTTPAALWGPKTRVITKPGTKGQSNQSYIDGSGFNTLLGNIAAGTGLNIQEKADAVDRDLTAICFGGGFVSAGGTDPVYYKNSFNGAAGAYANGEKGTATIGQGTLTKDGFGNLVMASGSYGQLVIAGPHPAARRVRAIGVRLAAAGDAVIINLRANTNPLKYVSVTGIKQADGTIDLGIETQAGNQVTQSAVAIADNVFDMNASIDADGNVSANINGGTALTFAAGVVNGTTDFSNVQSSNGLKLSEAEVKSL